MADRDRIAVSDADPVADEGQPAGVALAAQRRHVPAPGVARRMDRGSDCSICASVVPSQAP